MRDGVLQRFIQPKGLYNCKSYIIVFILYIIKITF